MNNFIKKTGIFLIASIFTLLTFIFTIQYIVNVKSNFSVRNDYKYVIFGHSHSECAFNDSLITNFKNLSSSAESYFYTFPKVKEILKKNKHIKTIFVEYSNNQIDKSIDNWIWGGKMMSAFLPLYSPFMKKVDLQLLYKNNSKDLLSAVSKSTRLNLIDILTSDYSLSRKYGGYLWLERNKMDSLLKVSNNSQEDVTNKNNEISIWNIRYLKKIVEYCHDNNVKIYLTRSPQYKDFVYLKNEITFINIKKTQFPEIEFLDFNNYPLTNEEFGDFGHLNHKGAKKFSIWFNSLLESGLLSMDEKQAFINRSVDKARIENKRAIVP